MYLSANPGGGRGGGGSGGGMGRGRSGRDMGLVGKTIRIVMGPYKVWLYQYCTSLTSTCMDYLKCCTETKLSTLLW